MKVFTFRLGDWQIDQLLAPIRTKRESLMLLMQLIKIMLVNAQIPDNRIGGELRLVVSKMSRLFLFSENKYLSFRFPFSVVEEGGSIAFSSAFLSSIDSQITSQIIHVLGDRAFSESFSPWEWIEPIIPADELCPGFWPMLLDLLLSEDGYLRYEYDKERENGRLHPLRHYDIFYSSPVTFKIGVGEHRDKDKMIDLLEQTTDCHYLEA